MKETKIKFTCDNCEKTIEIEGLQSFPYEEKWAYLYKLNFKLNPKNYEERRDRYFCCIKCMNDFIKKEIESAKAKQ